MPQAKGGFSSARLHRVTRCLNEAINRSDIAGAVSLIFRKRQVAHVDVLGWQDADRQRPMQRDTIFRIASMTKPITAVALLILMEEGIVRLDDPIEAWIPELSNPKVLRTAESPLDDVVSLSRPITIRDLITFKLGTGLLSPWERTPLADAMRESGLVSDRLGVLHVSPDEWLTRLGSLPLASQPGESWHYHFGSEITAILIARATGDSFGAFLRSRIFLPLCMNDTDFYVPPGKLDRFAACYRQDRKTRRLVLHDDPFTGDWSKPPTFQSGGGGLVSTADDYLRFGQMVLGKGLVDRVRIVSRPSMELMATDHLTAEQRNTPFFFWPHQWRARGYGFGVSVGLVRDEIWNTPGRLSWDGAFGTQWASDPHEDLVAMLMIQRTVAQRETNVCQDFWNSVYQAIDD